MGRTCKHVSFPLSLSIPPHRTTIEVYHLNHTLPAVGSRIRPPGVIGFHRTCIEVYFSNAARASAGPFDPVLLSLGRSWYVSVLGGRIRAAGGVAGSDGANSVRIEKKRRSVAARLPGGALPLPLPRRRR